MCREELLNLGTCILSDILGKEGVMENYIKPLYHETKMCGKAFTVKCFPGDNLAIHRALATAPAGSIIVVDVKGYDKGGVFGEIMATQAMIKNIAGIIIDGTCRDRLEMEDMGFPVFSRGVNPGGTTKMHKGTLNLTIQCGGVVVKPGDYIVGDANGVIVISEELIDEAIIKGKEKCEKEGDTINKIKQGLTTMEIMGLPE